MERAQQERVSNCELLQVRYGFNVSRIQRMKQISRSFPDGRSFHNVQGVNVSMLEQLKRAVV